MTNTDELKRLAEAATSGGWFEYGNDKQISVCAQPDGRFTYVIPMVKGNQSYRKDAKFIAAANPAAILSLIEEVEGLRVENERLTAERVKLLGANEAMADQLATLRAELDKALEVIGPFAWHADDFEAGEDGFIHVGGDQLRAASAFTERHKSQGESDATHPSDEGGRDA
jgi:hypothetical protein